MTSTPTTIAANRQKGIMTAISVDLELIQSPDIVEYHFGGKEEERIYEMYPIIHEVLLIVIVLFAEG